MKTFSILMLFSATIFSACGNNDTSDQSDAIKKDTLNNENHAAPALPTATSELVASYLQLKDALAGDSGDDAADAAKKMNAALAQVDVSAFTEDQKKVYDDVSDDLKEHAEHIASNVSKIAHQREHFDMMSQDMIDLVKVVGTSKTLYEEFCPMYNNKKGASWLSESRDIQNPYYGKEMPECGEVKEVLTAKGAS